MMVSPAAAACQAQNMAPGATSKVHPFKESWTAKTMEAAKVSRQST